MTFDIASIQVYILKLVPHNSTPTMATTSPITLSWCYDSWPRARERTLLCGQIAFQVLLLQLVVTHGLEVKRLGSVSLANPEHHQEDECCDQGHGYYEQDGDCGGCNNGGLTYLTYNKVWIQYSSLMSVTEESHCGVAEMF